MGAATGEELQMFGVEFSTIWALNRKETGQFISGSPRPLLERRRQDLVRVQSQYLG